MAAIPYVAENHCLYLEDGKFDPSETNNLDAIFEGIKTRWAQADVPRTLMVHFHGGLVDKTAGKDIAKSLYEACYDKVAYPVFFVWESGLPHTLQQALPRVFSEIIFQQLLERVGQFAIGKLDQQAARLLPGARGDVPLKPASKFYIKDELRKAKAGDPAFADKNPAVVPSDETLQPGEEADFYKALLTDPDLPVEAAKIANGLRPADEIAAEASTGTRGAIVQGSTYTLMSPEVIEEMRGESVPGVESRGITAVTVMARLALGGAQVLKRVIERFAQRRDHGVQATIIEEILREFYLGNLGRAVWDAMKQATRDAFNDDASIYGGTGFLERLGDLYASATPPQRVVLVGHSTGAIYICHLLRQANMLLPPEVLFEVIFLAPACDFKLLADTLHRYEKRISHFRLFGMHDPVEKAEFLLEIEQLDALPALKKLYPGSLLYFVSGVLEDQSDKPLAGMERFYLSGPGYDSETADYIEDVQAYLRGLPHSQVWSIDNLGDGLASESIHHGDFDNDPITLRSLTYIMQNGF